MRSVRLGAREAARVQGALLLLVVLLSLSALSRASRPAGPAAPLEPIPEAAWSRTDDIGRLWLGQRFDINCADARTLSVVPGIGPALAERIVTERVEGGAFTTISDVVRVRGVGPALSRALSEYAVVDAGAGAWACAARVRGRRQPASMAR